MDSTEPKKRKKSVKWSIEEDSRLISLCSASKKPKWRKLVDHFPRRTSKQIRDRWLNQLNPELDWKPFSSSEDWLLFLAYWAIGPSWTQIKELFPCRSDNQLKNRWNIYLQKESSEFESRLLSAQSRVSDFELREPRSEEHRLLAKIRFKNQENEPEATMRGVDEAFLKFKPPCRERCSCCMDMDPRSTEMESKCRCRILGCCSSEFTR